MSFMDNIQDKLLPTITQFQPIHSSAVQSISEHQYCFMQSARKV